MAAVSKRPTASLWLLAVLTAAVGVTWQYISLHLVEKFVTVYPSVPDILMNTFPQYFFGLWGEGLFFSSALLFAIPHFRWHWRDTPKVLISLGLFYFIRGWFMLLFPVGAPMGAVSPDVRLNIWGYATHAYFPGGHIGILTILAMNLQEHRWRWWLWVGIVLFGIGTMLAKNHYTMDSVAGIIIGYAVATWVGRRM